MKKNRAAREARFFVQCFDVVCQTTTWNSYLRFWRQRELAAVNLSFFAFTWKPFAPSKRKYTPPFCTTWSTWNNRKRLNLILLWRFPCSCRRSFLILGSLRSYDGNCKENVTLKLNFALSWVFCDYSMLITSYKIGGVHFRLFGTNGFHVKAKNERFTAASSRCRQNLKYENFTSSFGRLRQNIAPKSVVHVQHDYLSSFNQLNHWFVALSLTSSNPY